MATGDHDFLANTERVYEERRQQLLDNRPTYAHNPQDVPVNFAVHDPISASMDRYDTATDLTTLEPITTIKYRPEIHGFEVIAHGQTVMIPQKKIIDYVFGLAKENDMLKDAEKRVVELVGYLKEVKENISSLIECCDDESCEKDNLCDRCIMIKGWVS